MANKLREENKKLRSENDTLRDEILELKQAAHDAKKNQTTAAERSYLAPGRQESGSTTPQHPHDTSAARSNYYPGGSSTLATAQNNAISSSQYQRGGDSAIPSSYSQHNQPADASQSTTTYSKYEPYQRKGGDDHTGNANNPRGSMDTAAAGLSSQPYRPAMDDINQREPATTTLNDERFQQTYLRGEVAT